MISDVKEINIREFTEEDIKKIKFLIQDSTDDGFHGLERFYQEWATGRDKFNKVGEKLYIAVNDEKIIGICGINIDPFVNDNKIGRLRRVYVHSEYRRRGIAQQLIDKVLKHGRGFFQKVRLYTENAEAARLYEKIGFQRIAEERVSHIYYY